MKSLSVAALCAIVAGALLGVFALPGCGGSSKLYITKPFKTDLAKYPTATVVARGNGVKANKAAATLKQMIVERLEKENIFERVGPNGDIIIRAVIQNMDDGKEVKRELSLTGQADATVEVKVATPDGARLAHVTAEASSPREDEKDQPIQRVLRAAADEIVNYLKEHAPKGGR